MVFTEQKTNEVKLKEELKELIKKHGFDNFYVNLQKKWIISKYFIKIFRIYQKLIPGNEKTITRGTEHANSRNRKKMSRNEKIILP